MCQWCFSTFWRPLWSITEQTHGNMESICFIQWSEKKKDLYTRPPRTAWLFEDLCQFRPFFTSQTLLFVSASFFSLSYLYTVCSQKFFSVFSCPKQNNDETILQNASPSYRWHTMATVVRHSQVVKSSFCLRFLHFQNRVPCWTKQRKQVSRDVIHVSMYLCIYLSMSSMYPCIHVSNSGAPRARVEPHS